MIVLIEQKSLVTLVEERQGRKDVKKTETDKKWNGGFKIIFLRLKQRNFPYYIDES